MTARIARNSHSSLDTMGKVGSSMHRTRDWRRATNQRIIKKRLDLVKNAFCDPNYVEYLAEKPNRLNKYNLNCGCAMCQMNKTKRENDFSLDRELEAYDAYLY